MTNTVIKVEKTVIEGIEFYVSNDGKYTGMSQSGLAFLCGVNRNALQGLLNSGATSSSSKSLKASLNKEKWMPLESSNNAEVIPSSTCAEIIYYYAFESKAANEKARFSFKKFSTIGIDNWIKEIIGFKNENSIINNNTLIETLNKVLDKVTSLEKETKAYNTIRGKTTTVFPNLDNMLVDISNEKDLLPGKDGEELTATEWLEQKKGLTLNNSLKHRFTLLLSETYKTTTGRNPKKTVRRNKNGTINNGVSVYCPSEWCILELCLNKLLDRIS